MKNLNRLLPSLAAAVGLALGSAAALAEDNRYIIQFAPGAAGQGKAAVQAFGGQIKVDLTDRSVNAVAAVLPQQALNALQNNPFVTLMEVDEKIFPAADTVPYGISMVQADLVSDAFAGTQKVCVIDSGYWIDHVDLQSQGVTGKINSGSGDPFIDPCGHGTHVAGTIAALANGGGVLGVLPSGNVGLHIVKVFSNNDWAAGSCGYSYSSTLAAAAYECKDFGANVINMSLSGGFTETNQAAFADLYDNFGILSVASAGNGGNTQYAYPASYASVISVAAIDENKDLASFSQRNDQVELSGPGVGVLSTVPFTNANVAVDRDYLVEAMSRTATTTASGALVFGGFCTSAGNWSGQVVLCERGQVSFQQKVESVQAGGGVAAIVYNNEAGGFSGTLDCGGRPNRPCSSIPAVSMTQADGQSLVSNQLANTATVSTVRTVPASGYAFYNGTSMSAPHVAAVAALVWSYAPDATAAEIRAALAATAEDLGTPGRNNEFGYGLVQAQAAINYLAGTEPPPPPPPPENELPTAAFSYSCDALACSFDGSASTDSDGTIASYSWAFGDGNNGSGVMVNHSYASGGSYTVTLTVTDNAGATDSTSQVVTVAAAGGGGDPGTIGLTAEGYKVSGRWRTDLAWNGAAGANVDIYRNGSLLTTVSNTGAYTDATNFRGGGTLTYRVCEAGTSTCSDSVTVVF